MSPARRKQHQQPQQPQQQPQQQPPTNYAPSAEELGDRKARHLDQGYAWLMLLVMFLLQACSGGAQRAYGLVYAEQVRAGFGRQAASWPLASASFVENLAGCLTPLLARRLSWRRIQLLSLALMAAANLGAYLSRSLWLDTLLLGLVQGLALSMSTVLLLAANNDYFERFRTTAYGLAMSGSTCGTLCLTPLIGWLLQSKWAANQEGFRLAYLALGLLFCAALPLAWLVVPRASLAGSNSTDLETASPTTTKDRKQSRFESRFERQSSLASINVQCRIRRVSTLSRQSSLCSTCRLDQPAAGCQQTSPVCFTITSTATGLARSASAYRQLSDLAAAPAPAPAPPPREEPAASEEEEQWWPPRLLANPFFHCAWLMLFLYYTATRVFMIALADLAQDQGLGKEEAASLLGYWSLGELAGRLLLGPLIDLRLSGPRHCVSLTCLALGAALGAELGVELLLDEASPKPVLRFALYALVTASVAALSSLEYVLINVVLIEYLGRHRVTHCYSLAALVAALPLLARPALIGLFRDRLGSYNGLLAALALFSALLGALFWLLEPLARRRWQTPPLPPPPAPAATSKSSPVANK